MGDIDEASTDGFDFDLDISEPTLEETTGILPEGSEPEPQAPPTNPAWEAIFNEIPREFHSKIEPVLKTWDAGVKSEFEKRAQAIQQYQEQFKPWLQFQEQGLQPQQLMQAYAIMDRLNKDPKGFYGQMTELLRQRGLLEEQQRAAEDALDLDENGQEPQLVEDPRIAQLQNQLQQLIQYQQMREQATQQAQAEAAMDARIQQDMMALESKTGPLPDWVRDEVINRAMLMTEREKREVSFQEAYMDLQRVRQQMLSTPRPGQQAPRVVPGGGGYPAPSRNPEALKTPEGRAEAIKNILDRMGDA